MMARKEEAGRKLKIDGDANSQVRERNSFLHFFFGGGYNVRIYSVLGVLSKILWLIIIFHEVCMLMDFLISFLANLKESFCVLVSVTILV
jgi:hypothetical protein